MDDRVHLRGTVNADGWELVGTGERPLSVWAVDKVYLSRCKLGDSGRSSLRAVLQWTVTLGSCRCKVKRARRTVRHITRAAEGSETVGGAKHVDSGQQSASREVFRVTQPPRNPSFHLYRPPVPFSTRNVFESI